MAFNINDVQLGFIGAGNMTYALVKGFINYGNVKPEQICVSAPSDNNLPKFKDFGCHTTNNNYDIVKNYGDYKYKMIFLCVKPNVYKQKSQDIFNVYADNKMIIISAMAGVTVDTIRKSYQSCPDQIQIVRIMTNTACSVGQGIFGISFGSNVNYGNQAMVQELLQPLGHCEIVPEYQLDNICGLGGSGIAFVYNMIQAMTDGGVKTGLPRNIALNIASHTVLGAAKMVIETNKHPIQLRDDVTSPGGTTIYGLHELERHKFSSSVIDAVETATKRAQEFSKNN